MSSHRDSRFSRLLSILLALVLLGQFRLGSFAVLPASAAASEDQQSNAAAPRLVASGKAPAAPDACSSITGFDSTIDRSRFCVYYTSGTTTNAQATTLADMVDDYWDRYQTDFGFLAPLTTGTKLEIRVVSGGCNGVAWDNYAQVNQGCFSSNEEMQHTIGHELFHRVQFNYQSTWATNWSDIAWFYEGTARMMEDNVFNNIDNWPNAMTAAFSFNQEVNNYLNSTNNDITSFGMRYKAALWWKYFSERFGTTATEPERGVDAIRALWQAVLTSTDIAAVNNALGSLGAGTNFNAAFRKFVVANWTKGLTGLPDASYDYIDEKQAGNPAIYGPVTPAAGGTISTGTSASFLAQSLMRYGVKYYRATIGSPCPAVTASFHRTAGTEAFYEIVTQKGGAFAKHVSGSGADWKQSFLNDGLTQIVAIAGSLGSPSTVDVTLGCASPVVDVKQPNSGAVAHVGPAVAPGKLLAEVLVTDGTATGPVVAGLTNSDFKAKVNGANALITAGGFVQEQYWLVVQAPPQTANGTYDLEVDLEAPGTSTTIASDTNAASVTYDPDNTDQVLVIDRSGSMNDNNKIGAARDAANLYVDITRNNDGLAVVPFNHDINPAPFPMQSANLTVRNNAKTYINTLTPGGATSIGDGLQGAVTQRATSPTGNPRCSFVLLSDGMENTAAFYADVKAAVQASSCPVSTIAFGPESDETLMQTIANDNGGSFFYNDVFVSIISAPSTAAPQSVTAGSPAQTELNLGNVYEYNQGLIEGRQRLLAETGVVKRQATNLHKVNIDQSIPEALFVLDWTPDSFANLVLQLRKPDGTIIDPGATPYTFSDQTSKHVGWRIPNPDPGEWQLLVTNLNSEFSEAPYQVLVSGPSSLNAQLLLPDRLGKQYFTGDKLPIYALLSGQGPIPGAKLQAIISAPDGAETTLPLYDDGQHNDGEAGDGLYANDYTRDTQSAAIPPTGEDVHNPEPNNEGSYRVRLLASGDIDGHPFEREALGSFSVLGGPDDNNNGIPDNYEKANQISDANGDPDLDGLTNQDEYIAGTDPNNSDTDGGGENDGSEVLDHQQDPLNPADDKIEAPAFLHTQPENGAVHITYDVKADYSGLILYRSTNPHGPWGLEEPELPLNGAYDDPAANGQTYYYKLMAKNAGNHGSAVIDASGAKPSADPVPPEARVVIDNGALETKDFQVSLSFKPYDPTDRNEPDSFSDIKQMMLSNDPSFTGAGWQPFSHDVPWQLKNGFPGGPSYVYARFMDSAGNETVGTEVGSIIIKPAGVVYLPTVTRQ